MAGTNDIRLTISLKDLASGALGKVRGELRNLESNIGRLTSPIFNLKNSLASLGAGLAIKDVIGTFANFDDVMRQVGAVSGATEAEFAAMTATAEQLGATTRFSASEAADGMRLLAMAGFEAAQATEALPGVLNLAAAGSIELGDAADIASNMLSAYNMTAEELPRINDVMVQAFTSSNSTLGELGEAFKYVAPIAAGVGVEIEGLVAPMAKLHDAGIKGSMAGTALRGAIDALMNPTAQEAELMDELGKRIGGAGLQVTDSTGKFVGFTSIIEQMEGAGVTATEALNLFGLRAGPGMQALISQGSDALREMEQQLENSGGKARQVAEDMEAGIGGSIRSMKSAWEGFKLALGSGLEGAATEAIRYFTDRLRAAIQTINQLKADGTLGEWAAKIGEAFQRTVGYLEGMTRALFAALNGPMKPLVDTFIRWAPEIVAVSTGLLALQKGLSVVNMGMGAVNAAMGMGQWVAYLRHVQTASTYTNLLTVATASLGNAMTMALGAVGAFFAGWQVGKLISASDFFGTMPITIGESVQVGFGMLDEFLTRTKIKFLELRKVWNEVTGDDAEVAAIEQMIEAEKEHINTIHQTVASIGEKQTAQASAAQTGVKAVQAQATAEKAAQVERVTAAMSAEEQIKATQRSSVNEYLANLKTQTEAAKAELDRRNAEIELAEARGVVTHNQAQMQKLQADAAYYQQTIQKAVDAEQQAAQSYGRGSEQYKQAQEAKKAALDGWLQKEQAAAEQVMALANQVAESQKSSEEKIRELRRKNMDEYSAYQDRVKEIREKLSEAQQAAATDTQKSIELYKEAMNAAASVSNEVRDGEQVVVSQQNAVNTAIGLVEQAQKGIESAAASQTAAIESGMEATRRSADEAKSGIGEVTQAMDAASDKTISIQADGTAAVAEIGRVKEGLDALTDAEIQIAIETATAERAIAGLSDKVDALHAKAAKATKSIIEFRGKASPEAGLTETIDRVSGKIGEFQARAAAPVKSVSEFRADFGNGPTGYSEALSSVSGDFRQFAETQEVAFTGLQDKMGASSGALFELLNRGKVSLDDSFESVRVGVAETVEGVQGNWASMSDEMIKGMIYVGKQTVIEADNMGKSFNGQVDEMKSNVRTLEEELARRKEVNVDGTAAKASLGELNAETNAVKENIGKPARMDIDISPAKQALREIAQEAYKNAVQSEKLAREYATAIRNSHGEERRLHKLQYDRHKKQAQKLTTVWQKFKPRANVDFTGTGSTQRPLSEKIAEMSGAMGQFARGIGDQVINADFSPIRKGMEDVAKETVGNPFQALLDAGYRRGSLGKTGDRDVINAPRNMGKLTIGGQKDEIYGQPDTLRKITDAVKKEKRMGLA